MMRTKTRGLLIAFMSAVMLAITAAGANAGANADPDDASAAASVTLRNSEGCYDNSPTPDNCTVDMYYGSHRFGDVTWNDYYDSDHSRDVDNIYVNYQLLKQRGLSLVPAVGCGVSATLGSNGSPLGRLTTALLHIPVPSFSNARSRQGKPCQPTEVGFVPS